MRLFQWVTGIKRSLWVGISVSLVLGIYEGTQEVPQWQLGDGSPSLWSRAVTSKLSLVWVLRTSLLTIIISWKNYATRLANYATMFRIILAYCVNQIVGYALSHGVTDSKWTHVGRLLYGHLKKMEHNTLFILQVKLKKKIFNSMYLSYKIEWGWIHFGFILLYS